MLARVGLRESTGMKPTVNNVLPGVQVSPINTLMLSESSMMEGKHWFVGDFISHQTHDASFVFLLGYFGPPSICLLVPVT